MLTRGSTGRASPPWQRADLARQPAGLVQGPAQQHLDLGVQAPELVARPPLQRVVDGRVQPQQHLASFGHQDLRYV